MDKGSYSSDGTIQIRDITNIGENKGYEIFHIVFNTTIPNISVMDYSFTQAEFHSDEVKKLIEMNGGYT